MIHGHHLHLNLGEVAFYDAGLGKGRARHKQMSLAKQSVLKKLWKKKQVPFGGKDKIPESKIGEVAFYVAFPNFIVKELPPVGLSLHRILMNYESLHGHGRKWNEVVIAELNMIYYMTLLNIINQIDAG